MFANTDPMFRLTVGSSSNPDTAEAVGEIIARALERMTAECPQAGIIYNRGHSQDATILRALKDTWPEIRLVGFASEAPGPATLTVMLMSSPDLEFHVGSARRAQRDPMHAAEQALGCLSAPMIKRVTLCLTPPSSDQAWINGFSRNVEQLLPPGTVQLRELLPYPDKQDAPVANRLYLDGEVLTDTAPVLFGVQRRGRHTDGWRHTRHSGVMRRLCDEDVYEYDQVVGERRRYL